MKKNLMVVLITVIATVGAFAAAAGIASAVNGDGDAPSAARTGAQEVTAEQQQVREAALGPKITIVDHEGNERGTVNHEDLYVGDTNQAQEGLLLAAVHDDAGDIVGYYSNIAGYLEKEVVEAPGFNHEQYLADHGKKLPPSP